VFGRMCHDAGRGADNRVGIWCGLVVPCASPELNAKMALVRCWSDTTSGCGGSSMRRSKTQAANTKKPCVVPLVHEMLPPSSAFCVCC